MIVGGVFVHGLEPVWHNPLPDFDSEKVVRHKVEQACETLQNVVATRWQGLPGNEKPVIFFLLAHYILVVTLTVASNSAVPTQI